MEIDLDDIHGGGGGVFFFFTFSLIRIFGNCLVTCLVFDLHFIHWMFFMC